MKTIEVRPSLKFKGAWTALKMGEVEPFFAEPGGKNKAISYARGRFGGGKCEIRVFDDEGKKIVEVLQVDDRLPETETDFVTLWKMGYARESFKNVRTICDFIEEHRLNRQSPIHHPLCVALAVFYARPFKSSNVIGAIPATMVPKDSRYLHYQILAVRDQVAAHTDGDAANHGKGGPPANNVRVIIGSDGTRSLGVYELKYKADAIRQIRTLAEILIRKTTYHVEKPLNKMLSKIPTMPGEYLMDLESKTFRRDPPKK